VATARFDEPNITATGTVTDAATVYVAGAPTEGGTGNYSLWVDDGAVQLDSTLTVGGDVSFQGGTTIGNATGDAFTINPSAWTLANAVTITGTWANLGAVTTVDVNGGTLDGVTIGGASAAAATFTTATLATLNATASTISSNATTLSFDSVGTIDTSGNNILTLNSGTAHLDVTTGLLDVTGPGTFSGTLTASGILNVGTATNWQLGSVAYTGSMANLNTLRDDSMADALHRHSELSASDGSPNPTVQVDAAGLVGINVFTGLAATLNVAGTLGLGYYNPADFDASANRAILGGGVGSEGVTIFTAATGTGRLAFGDAGGAATYRGFVDYRHTTDAMVLGTAAADRVIINSSGNVGIGVVPSGWHAAYTAFQLGGNATMTGLTATTAGNLCIISLNANYDTDASWKYISTDEAANYYMLDGTHNWRVAASGTAGTDITWTQALTLTNAGQLLVGTATASANAAGPSMLIAQGPNDDDALILSSTDVAHGMTTLEETANYFALRKASPLEGGMQLRVLTEATRAAVVYTMATTEDVTHTAAGNAAFEVYCGTKSGTSVTNPGTNANLFAVRLNDGTTQFIVDADGDLFANGSDVTVYDSDEDGNPVDDVQLVRAFDLAGNSDRLIRSQWDEYVKYREDDLVKAGILGAPRSEGGLVCITQLQRLHNGAIWQLGIRTSVLDTRMAHLEMAVEARQQEIEELRRELALLREVN